jgi:Domain of unknown function (DUF1816)
MSFTICREPEQTFTAWWLEIGIMNPICLGYFGPFQDEDEANKAQQAHLAELQDKDLKVVFARSRFCRPRKMTILENELTIQDLETTPVHFFEALVL